MNTYILAIMMVVMSITGVQAQRLIKGQNGFEVSVGFLSDMKLFRNDFYVQAGMTINGKNGSHQLWAVEFSRKKHEFENDAIPVETYSGEGGYSFVLLGDWSKNISLNMGITGVAGYEVINKSKKLLPSGAVIQNKDSFIYGGGLRLSLETYLSDHVVMLVQGRTKAVWGTSLERFRPSAGVGIRYIF
ncbi:conjugal transfer protein TraO [Chryseobacterium polytrichastri]|uniref:Conjugative transposon protein TraO n=1 Tax=Chryseobacterium polytrichastri TaxID=1302687 RepID=A0A1M7DK34_9FLAO|nr:conjugal transfer protein TraO [Chryseobacterium polytrichastri]SHL79840.1 Conjugative transposon protein TraO [Chryseobacterium polytrichastri]